ncbi:phosphatase PAP2 family protein [Cellulomonas telluris]|uniref:phosphatase PAP2 family protein n=1 Tax=Cellulomonas telluris TaxID=2306636 RepID=UPI001FEBEC9A|nr:phosphatase PAP2 family protein [Cellulomonas telluris]
MRYLERYAAHHGLDVRTGVEVVQVEPSGTGRRLRTADGDALASDVVVVATGYNHTPVPPAWPGVEDFAGTLVHGSAYRGAHRADGGAHAAVSSPRGRASAPSARGPAGSAGPTYSRGMTGERRVPGDGDTPTAPQAGSAWRRAAQAVASAAVLAVPVAAVAWAVRAESSTVHRLDVRAVAAATDATRDAPALHAALVVWQEVTQPVWLVLAGCALCAWVWRRRQLPGRALWGAVTLLASWGTTAAVKLVVHRARPVHDDPLAHAGGFSFPSGHANMAATAGVVLTVVAWPLLGRRGRVLVPTVAAAVAAVTAADRVLLGVHHPSDVVAGLLLGSAVAVGSWLAYRGDERPGWRVPSSSGRPPRAAPRREPVP